MESLQNQTEPSNISNKFPEGCLVINSTESNGDWISREMELVTNKIRSAILLPILFSVGAPANVLCMVVFHRQGLMDRINVCLFSLALVDLIYIVFHFLLHGDQMFQFHSHQKYGPVAAFVINKKMFGLRGLGSGSMFLTALISCERCVCVLLPLRSKHLLSTTTMIKIIISGVFITSLPELISMARYDMACYFDIRTGQSLMDLYVNNFYYQNKTLIYIINSFFYGIFISIGCPLVVVCTTTATAVRLRQTVSKRRLITSSDSAKEVGVTRMLLALSAQFILFSLPQVMLKLAPYFDSEFRVGGRHEATLLFLNLIWNILTCANATVHFFVYLCAGSKFRKTLQCLCR